MALYYVSAGVTVPAATHVNIAAVNADGGIISGDTVFFNRGETFNDATLTCDAGVTYDAYGSGAIPVIDGVGTHGCVSCGSVDAVTIQNLDLINGTKCLSLSGTCSNFNGNNLVIRGHVGNAVTTECVDSTASGTGNALTNVDIYQPNNTATSKGLRLSSPAGFTCTNVEFIGVVGLIAYNAIEIVTNSLPVALNNVTFTNWNGRGGAGSRLLYLRGADVTSTKFTVNDCDGQIYMNLLTSETTAVFDELNVSNMTGVIQSLNASDITVKSGIWNNTQATLLGANIDVNGVTANRQITISSGTTLATLANISSNDSTVAGITSAATTTNMDNVNVLRAANQGIIISEGTATLNACSAKNGAVTGLRQENAAIVSDTLGDYSNNADDGVTANNTGSISCFGTIANTNGSVTVSSGDGFTAHDSSTLNLYGCEGSKNWKSGVAVVQTTSGVIYNCSFYDNFEDVISPSDNYGIRIDATGGWDVKNNITEGHSLELSITAAAVAAANVTIDYGCYNNTRVVNAFNWNGTSYNWADYLTNSVQDLNSVNDDPLFTDKASLNLSIPSNSPAIALGTKTWGNGPRYHGSNSEPYPDTFIDVGSRQTTFNTGHPKNL